MNYFFNKIVAKILILSVIFITFNHFYIQSTVVFFSVFLHFFMVRCVYLIIVGVVEGLSGVELIEGNFMECRIDLVVFRMPLLNLNCSYDQENTKFMENLNIADICKVTSNGIVIFALRF